MKKIYITGFSGFVGYYFMEYFENSKMEVEILGTDLSEPAIDPERFKFAKLHFQQINLLDQYELLEKSITDFKPDYIIHLAALSSVGSSWKNPAMTFKNNTSIFLNLLEIIRLNGLQSRLLSVGSSEVYGCITPEQVPLREDSPLEPNNPYSVARLSQEYLTRVYVEGYGLHIVSTRSFNHIGPRQKDVFVIASFAKQLAEAKLSKQKKAELNVGNISIIRDFLDVRDVVNAYYQILTNGKNGEVYNVCSGEGVSLKEIINTMAGILNIEVDIRVDNSLLRPNDADIIVGSYEKLNSATGWKPGFKLYDTLKDILSYWLGVK